MRFLFRTDVHAADKAPVSWKADYRAEVLDNLRQIGDLAKTYKVDAVLDGGDFFHVKSPVKTSHSLVVEVMQLHAKHYPCPVYSIEGNHDVVGNNLDTIDQQPLGVLYTAGTFKMLREEVFERDGVKVRVVGIGYNKSLTVEDIQALRKTDEDCLIAVVHALASENPPPSVEEFFGEPVFKYDSLIFDRGPDVFLFGHWHRDQGISVIDGRHFVNQGAVSRGALVKENLERIPKVALITVEKGVLEVESIPLSVLPASEVFDLEAKQRQDTENVVIDMFVQELNTNFEVADSEVSVEAAIANMSNMNFATTIRDRALQYFERVRG